MITDLAVIDITPDGPLLSEIAPGVSTDEVASKSEPTLRIPAGVVPLMFSP